MLDTHIDVLTAEAAPTLRAINGVGPRTQRSAGPPRSMPPPAVNIAIGSPEGVADLLHGEQVSDALSITAASVASFASYAAAVLGP